jgi:hypothetical protein
MMTGWSTFLGAIQGISNVYLRAIAMFIYIYIYNKFAMVNMDIVYGAEASGGEFRSLLRTSTLNQTIVIIVRMAITENRFDYQ